MDDRPLKEIAAIMQMPEGTVKSHLSRSKAKMAKVFN
jgi:DNA-directed RNA polymerase specialized sigma24 family protein